MSEMKIEKKKEQAVVGFFENESSLKSAMAKVVKAKFENFDAYTPYPVHGLEKIQGISRSKLPYVTFGAAIVGFGLANILQGWTSVFDWPLNVGGKPFWSWQAFVPIMFELTVLLAGLATFAGLLAFCGLPNVTKKIFDSSITRDRFAIAIEQPKKGDLDTKKAEEFLKSVGAQEVRTVQCEGWF